VDKQQRAWSQSGRQHIVTLVNVARFELKLHKAVKRVLAFILSDLIWKKGGVCLFCFAQMFYLLWIERKGCFVYPALHMCSLFFILLFTSLLRAAFSFLSLWVTKYELMLDMAVRVGVLAGSRGWDVEANKDLVKDTCLLNCCSIS